LLSSGIAAHAQAPAAPRPPCDGDSPVPAYAAAGQPPNSATWRKIELPRSSCLPWTGRFRLVVALGGAISHDGDAAALLARFGAISSMRGLEYWSVTENATRVLVKDPWAVDSPDARQQRADFRVQEMTPGSDLYFVEVDNRSSEPVTYRMRVLFASADSITVETQNTTPISAMGLKLIPPGALRAQYFLRRLDPRTWGFYGISATSEAASGLVSMGEASYINRAEALYRHFSGQPAR
jgi:hypothetical protein